MQDMGELTWAKGNIKRADKLVMFIRNRQFTQSLSREFCSKELLKPSVTCFGTNLIMIDRLLELKAGLQVRIPQLVMLFDKLRKLHAFTKQLCPGS